MENTNIIKALIKAQGELKEVSKDGTNAFHKYKYATLQSYLHQVRPVLIANDLSVSTSVEDVVPLEGGRLLAKMKVSLFHTSGECLDSFVFGEGQDISSQGKVGDKALYKAITGGRKYALANLFNIATTDDPEKDETTHKDKPKDERGRTARAGADMSKGSEPIYLQGLFVADVHATEREYKGKKYEVFEVRMSDGNTYSTGLKKLADKAQELCETGEMTSIEFQRTDGGLKLLSI